ncbi:MAG: type II 3-dehydroquinate dehydratase [Firmicutes bacterium]|nr:type II 3-dehydroquinate dehydratase [Bacillota bacterium]
MKILVINGPNINMLGVREPEIYGSDTYEDLMELTRAKAREISEKNYSEGRDMVKVNFIQSNHEGEIVTAIQKAYCMYDGIIINPAAYTHTSIAILDAIKAVGIPTVEVHISDVSAREEWRQISYIREACIATVMGEGIQGYEHALEILVENIGKK